MTLKSVINEALREGLTVLESHRPSPPRFTLEPHRFGLKAGIDYDKLGQFADELEDEEVVTGLQ